MLRDIPVINKLSSTQRPIALTLGLLILYELGTNTSWVFLLPAGTLPLSAQDLSEHPAFRIGALGWLSALTGFFIVEISSFFLPLFKRYREGGVEGRKQLTKWSLIVSLLVAIWHASMIIYSLRAMRFSTGEPVLANASLFRQGLLGLVLVLGFVMICGLAVLITRHGIGNGFCVIIGYDIITSIPYGVYELLTSGRNEEIPLDEKNIMTGESPNLVGLLVLVFVLVALYKKFWHRVPGFYKSLRPMTLKTQTNGKPVDFELPYLPQGVFTLLWPSILFMYLMSAFQFIPISPPEFLSQYNTWTYLLISSLLLVGVSYLGYFLISHPARIVHNTLGKITFQDGWENKVDTNAVQSIIFITLAWFLWHVPYVIIKGGNILYELIDLTGIIILAAIAKDMISEYRFMENSENHRVLETFDNVHFVTVLKGLFEAEGIRFCVQAFEYRRLFYFFEPLIKMRVLVDKRDWEKAVELADLENVTII